MEGVTTSLKLYSEPWFVWYRFGIGVGMCMSSGCINPGPFTLLYRVARRLVRRCRGAETTVTEETRKCPLPLCKWSIKR